MRKSVLFLNILLATSLFLVVSAKAVIAAPHLIMSPATGSYASGANFDVTIKIDSATNIVGGADVLLTYDSTKLDLVSVTKSTAMVFAGGDCSVQEVPAGTVYVNCYTTNGSDDAAVSGDLLNLVFKGKAVGTAAASFTCVGTDTGDSNIGKGGVDIISCGENVNGSYTITAGSASTPATTQTTTTQTSTTVQTPTIARTTLPQTGGVATTVGLVIFGAISLLSALLLRFL